MCLSEQVSVLSYADELSQLAHNVLRTICFLELGESVVVLLLFGIQLSHHVLGLVLDTQIEHKVVRTICFLGGNFSTSS